MQWLTRRRMLNEHSHKTILVISDVYVNEKERRKTGELIIIAKNEINSVDCAVCGYSFDEIRFKTIPSKAVQEFLNADVWYKLNKEQNEN